MKWSTLVVYSILCFLELESSNGTCVVPSLQAGTKQYISSTSANQLLPESSSSVVALLTNLCTSSTLHHLPPSTLVTIVNTLSTTPQLSKVLPSSTLLTLLSTISSSPCVLNELSPIALLILLAAVSSSSPSSISTIPPCVLFPLLKKLTSSGLISSGTLPVFAQVPLPPAPPQVIVPGPAPGPIYINLPKKSRKPPPIFIPSGPPPSIVISIPQPFPPSPPMIMPQNTPGPIIISEDLDDGFPPKPIVLPAPQPPNIYLTTHPSKTCPQIYCKSFAGDKTPPIFNRQ